MNGSATPERILDALRLVIDPELGINIVDLGLVYRAEVRDGHVSVAMTMTTPVCPLGEPLAEQVEASIRHNVPGVKSVSIELVWEPPWTPSRMSSEARGRLGWA